MFVLSRTAVSIAISFAVSPGTSSLTQDLALIAISD